MNYPLISEYIEAIKAAEDNFKELTNLRAVLGDDGQPVMTSGNFAVVFKMQDIETEKFYALKCFTKEQEERAEAYHQITDALKDVDSPYLVSLRYFDKELFVDTDQTADTEFPILLMDWVEGKTLDKYLRDNLDDKYALEMLAYRFSNLAQWLIPQPFAHGDLKPDNILVHEDGTLVLVDYDGMYVTAMKGQKARELGSPNFRHPQRTENDYDEHIDDFPLVSILLSLKAISIEPQLLEKYGSADSLIISEKDYLDISSSKLLKELFPSSNSELNVLLGLFTLVFENKNLVDIPSHLFCLMCPPTYYELVDLEREASLYITEKIWSYIEFAEQFDNIVCGYAYHSAWERVEKAYYFTKNGNDDVIVYNFGRLSMGQINKYKKFIKIELKASGHYVLTYSLPKDVNIENLDTETHITDYSNCFIDNYGVKYSSDKKRLLEAPVKELVKGSHTWRKSILNGSYIIPNGTIVICDKAFFDCRELTSITCPYSLKAIGAGAFSSCWGLKKVFLNYDLLEIGDEAFNNCKYLRSIIIPERISYISKNAFKGSGIVEIFTIPGEKTRIESMLPDYKDIIKELPF